MSISVALCRKLGDARVEEIEISGIMDPKTHPVFHNSVDLLRRLLPETPVFLLAETGLGGELFLVGLWGFCVLFYDSTKGERGSPEGTNYLNQTCSVSPEPGGCRRGRGAARGRPRMSWNAGYVFWIHFFQSLDLH